MRWFGKNQGEDKVEREQRAQRDLSTQQALREGRVPPYVMDRIRSKQQGDLPWSSNLSVNEWLLLKKYGAKPLGTVVGSSFYHIGFSMTGQGVYGGDQNLTYVEQAMQENRRLALSRLQQEAQAMGADAVVDVRLQIHKPGIHEHETEFVAVGTAVSFESLESSQPVLCNVSGMDLVKLLSTGHQPVGIAMGISVRYQYTTYNEQRTMDFSWTNQEMGWFTDAVYTVRHQAVERMREEAKRLGGTGILAHDTNLHVFKVHVERGKDDERLDHILEFVSLGTVIRETNEKLSYEKPVLFVDMNK